MKDNIWAKAATGAFTLLAVVAGWGLNEVYHLGTRVEKVEVVQAIWLTSTGHSLPATNRMELDGDVNMHYASMPIRGEAGTEFARKGMIHAADQILQKDCAGAIKTLLVVLENTGSPCFTAGDHLECK